MNIQKVRKLIGLYKEHFLEIHNLEIYKWRIVKRFQDRWDIEAIDFYSMLQTSLRTSRNLLASGNYFPRRMLRQNTAIQPEEVRGLFRELFDEETDLLTRVANYRKEFRLINERNYPGTNSFQDDRAILVYLSLRYPDIYYLYKFTMFQEFVGLVDYPFSPRLQRPDNVTQYLTMCSLIKEEIIQDSELLDLHSTRIGETEYSDGAYNILTQDLIYAATKHLPHLATIRTRPPASQRLRKSSVLVLPQKQNVVLKGSFTNYLDLEKARHRIGLLGELLVFEHEQEKLRRLGIRKEPIHVSQSEGDGLGYDILSYNENGDKVYIEVKTTSGGVDQPFYVTANELERSIVDANGFVLYRLFEFDDTLMTAKYFERLGKLVDLCNNPILYRAMIARQ